jgi:hypothetical protein
VERKAGMKASKRKKKLRWLQRDAANPRRANVIRNMARAEIEKIRRKHG